MHTSVVWLFKEMKSLKAVTTRKLATEALETDKDGTYCPEHRCDDG